MKTKIIAMYLPQYHCIPENDEFWGKGFTDWTTVKGAKSLFKGHKQPRVPLNNNYYDLSVDDNIVWQAKLAKENGIYGFGIYHYWFNNEKNLLTKPAEIFRDNADIDLSYFLAWDNASWKRSWSNVVGNDWAPIAESKESRKGPAIMINYEIGTEKDWENHYNNVKSHFLSPKYIKMNNKPIFIIFNYGKEIEKMCDYWNELSKKDGFDGMHFIFRKKESIVVPNRFYEFKYEPLYSGWPKLSLSRRIEGKLRKILHINNRVFKYDYDTVWRKIINNAQRDSNIERIYHGCFVRYDDTPRRGKRGSLTYNESSDKFRTYLKRLVDINNSQNKPFIFLTAWNEWGEGAYLEPDTNDNMSYLNGIKDIQL